MSCDYDFTKEELQSLSETKKYWEDIFNQARIGGVNDAVDSLIIFFKTWNISDKSLKILKMIFGLPQITGAVEKIDSNEIVDKFWWINRIKILFIEEECTKKVRIILGSSDDLETESDKLRHIPNVEVLAEWWIQVYTEKIREGDYFFSNGVLVYIGEDRYLSYIASGSRWYMGYTKIRDYWLKEEVKKIGWKCLNYYDDGKHFRLQYYILINKNLLLCL